MEPSDILSAIVLGTKVELTHQCKTEQGIDSDEEFVIVAFFGSYEQLCIKNQYEQGYIINPNQIEQ